jgi:UDP-N-acetylglucosamine 2-epimerase (non-hydrolysing)
MKKKVICIVGTRPEAIKMAPVILRLQAEPWAEVKVLATAQHREMLDQVLTLFGIEPDIDLDLMTPNQSLAFLTARLYEQLDRVFEAESPDMVLAQGDTTTVNVAGVVSFYRQIPFGHVEAGLRTHDKSFPFPEEMNRVFVDYVADLHFAPTEASRRHLLQERISEQSIHVTGNTVIDALFHVRDRQIVADDSDSKGRTILVTAHRRENFGQPLLNICSAIISLLEDFPDVNVLWPVHPNPNVSGTVHQELGSLPRVRLVEPLDYEDIVKAMREAYLILTDSGGIQEEAPALAKPVLVLRAETERPEAVELGVVKLVGTDRNKILESASLLLKDKVAYEAMAKGVSPYGDGHASDRICQIIAKHFGVNCPHATVADQL